MARMAREVEEATTKLPLLFCLFHNSFSIDYQFFFQCKYDCHVESLGVMCFFLLSQLSQMVSLSPMKATRLLLVSNKCSYLC